MTCKFQHQLVFRELSLWSGILTALSTTSLVCQRILLRGLPSFGYVSKCLTVLFRLPNESMPPSQKACLGSHFIFIHDRIPLCAADWCEEWQPHWLRSDQSDSLFHNCIWMSQKLSVGLETCKGGIQDSASQHRQSESLSTSRRLSSPPVPVPGPLSWQGSWREA